MMENMGWQGKGLGKQEQGMLNPLITKKAAGNTGLIVESSIVNPDMAITKQTKAKLMNVLVTSVNGDPEELRGLFSDYGEIADSTMKMTE